MARVVQWAAVLCVVVAILIGAIYGERVMSARRWERWHQQGRDAEAALALQVRATETARDAWKAALEKSPGEKFLKQFNRQDWQKITWVESAARTSLLTGDYELAEQQYGEIMNLLAQMVVAANGCRLAIRTHREGVARIAFSPDGKTLVAGGGNRMRLWNAETGDELWGLGVGDYFSIAFSPDGKMMAVSSNDRARLWDVQTRGHVRTLRGSVRNNGGRHLLVFSPKGKTLMTTGLNDTLKLWNVATGECVRTFKGHGRIYSVAISPDGKTLALVSHHGDLRFWNAETGDHIRAIKDVGWDRSLAFSPDGRTLAAGGWGSHSVKLWDVATGELLRTIRDEGCVRAFAFSPDGKILASGCEDKTVKLWDLATGHHIRTIEGHTKWVDAVAFSPDGKTLASGSRDDTIKFWNLATVKTFAPKKGNP